MQQNNLIQKKKRKNLLKIIDIGSFDFLNSLINK